MVFCNRMMVGDGDVHISHNPYFNRWFSAIPYKMVNRKRIESHNPYFNRWFSAMW